MRWLAQTITAFSLSAMLIAPIRADDLIGRASVVDGDTIEIHSVRIRLFGIDAPESDQLCRNEESDLYRCGQKASNELASFIGDRPVQCVEVDRDRYKRAVSVCTIGRTDIGDWLVRKGIAVDWPQYSKGSYAEAQADAKKHDRGMWSGSFKDPWVFGHARELQRHHLHHPALIEVMKKVLEDTMTRVPSEHSTPQRRHILPSLF